MCMSIVASAFQYGWAPTLMPLTTTLISPPSWVKRTIRSSAAATQSMFSVPESIAIFAPEESANHSTGTPSSSARSSAAITRSHSGSASEPSERVGSPSSTTRRMPSGWRSVRLRTSPTTMLARLVAGGRSTGTSWPSPSRSCSTNSPARDRRARLRALRGQHLDDLRGMQAAAAARGDDPLGALVERLQRLVRRVAELDGDAAAGGAEDAQRAVALDAVLAHARAELDHLEAEPGARAREAADDLAGLGRGEVHRRPGVEQQPVPVQALARRPARLDGAHRLERLAHHPLELGQRGDAAGLVADRREVAHLGERDQPLVARVRVRDGAEQVDVLRRGQPLEVELAQPPHVHPLGHHRVHAADGRVLGERAVAVARVGAHVDGAVARVGRARTRRARPRPGRSAPASSASRSPGSARSA